ncbi:MAG: peptide chain release factor N(5)-glutamine methyltransferase [Oscillospiraceae bacterium]|nr:peptide chain release factor N(5)-glutamine methyltransferase [Oscillospiraceae bacterium]
MNLLEMTAALKQAGIENAVNEANWIIRYVMLSQQEEVVRRRIAGEPLQYLLGEWEFYGYPIKVGPGVLIPRQETELLVELVDEYFRDGGDGLVFDLCSGSGCVGIAIAKETGRDVMAFEKSDEAVAYLRENTRLNCVQHKVILFHRDILDEEYVSGVLGFIPEHLREKLLIVINPPYLSKEEILTLQKEVRHEPMMALFGGGDGLEFYRDFFRVWREQLRESRLFACEVGFGQAEAVAEMFEEIGLNPQIREDYNGIERVVYSVREEF